MFKSIAKNTTGGTGDAKAMGILADQVQSIVDDLHNIDVKYDKMIEDLKKEMNFSSLMYMVTEKADMSSVN